MYSDVVDDLVTLSAYIKHISRVPNCAELPNEINCLMAIVDKSRLLGRKFRQKFN